MDESEEHVHMSGRGKGGTVRESRSLAAKNCRRPNAETQDFIQCHLRPCPVQDPPHLLSDDHFLHKFSILLAD